MVFSLSPEGGTIRAKQVMPFLLRMRPLQALLEPRELESSAKARPSSHSGGVLQATAAYKPPQRGGRKEAA